MELTHVVRVAAEEKAAKERFARGKSEQMKLFQDERDKKAKAAEMEGIPENDNDLDMAAFRERVEMIETKDRQVR